MIVPDNECARKVKHEFPLLALWITRFEEDIDVRYTYRKIEMLDILEIGDSNKVSFMPRRIAFVSDENAIIFEHFTEDFYTPLLDAPSLAFSDWKFISVLFTEWWSTKISFHGSCQPISRESVNVQACSNRLEGAKIGRFGSPDWSSLEVNEGITGRLDINRIIIVWNQVNHQIVFQSEIFWLFNNQC